MSFSGEMKEEIALEQKLQHKRRLEHRDGDHPLLRKNPQAGRERGSFHGNRECRAGKDVCQINKKSI